MRNILLISFAIGSLVLMSFYQKDTLKEPTPTLVQKAFEEKISIFLQNRKEKCLEKILEDAEAYVDSIIISEINVKLLDTLIFPEKPLRPDFPSKIILNDSTKIEPIVKDEKTK